MGVALHLSGLRKQPVKTLANRCESLTERKSGRRLAGGQRPFFRRPDHASRIDDEVRRIGDAKAIQHLGQAVFGKGVVGGAGVIEGYAARLNRQALGLGLMAFVAVNTERHTDRAATRAALASPA